MNTFGSNIKSLCEDYLNHSSNDDYHIKLLNKFLSILKSSDKLQNDIFIHLSDRGINKLLSSLKDKNQEIRKLSSKLILDVLNNNEVLQNIFCEKFNFNPIGNVICINWLPKIMKDQIKIDENFLKEIKSSLGLNNKSKYWLWPANSKYGDDSIPDPQKYLLGFYYANRDSFSIVSEEKPGEERIDTKMLRTRLENECLDDDHYEYVAAGSGSMSSTKIKENILSTEPGTAQIGSLILKKHDDINSGKLGFNSNQIQQSECNKAKGSSNTKNNNDNTSEVTIKHTDYKTIKNEYKKREKNYSKSIDSNVSNKVITTKPLVANNKLSSQKHPQTFFTANIISNNTNSHSNKIDKVKK